MLCPFPFPGVSIGLTAVVAVPRYENGAYATYEDSRITIQRVLRSGR
jgi:hypothetical protein